MSDISQKMKWVSVKQLTQLFPFSEGSLRYWIFHGKQNGLEKSMRRIGRKIIIDVCGFEEWLNRNGGQNERN